MFKCQFIYVLLIELVLAILYGTITDLAPEAAASRTGQATTSTFSAVYPKFQDVHVMIFVGFGFLMVFLRHHPWTSVTFNFLVSAFVIQIFILLQGFWLKLVKEDWSKIHVGLEQLIGGDFAAGAVLISFGAVLGKVNSFQLLVMATIETIFYSMNAVIGYTELQTTDVGGSIFIHTFGAYFGLAVSAVVSPKTSKNSPLNTSSQVTNLVAMVGTIFLWMFWPSFNGALASGNAEHRVVVNTVLTISASCVGAFMMSTLTHNGKYEMEDILNATLAGGVLIGALADVSQVLAWPIIIGFLGGLFSAFGFAHINGALNKKLGLHDTCGVHYLHGLPGVISGVLSAIFAATAGNTNDETWGLEVNTLYPGRANGERSAGGQAGVQIGALFMTLGIAIGSGLFTGFILRCGCFQGPKQDADFYNDDFHFVGAEPEKEAEEKDYQKVRNKSLEFNSVKDIQSGMSVKNPEQSDFPEQRRE